MDFNYFMGQTLPSFATGNARPPELADHAHFVYLIDSSTGFMMQFAVRHQALLSISEHVLERFTQIGETKDRAAQDICAYMARASAMTAQERKDCAANVCAIGCTYLIGTDIFSKIQSNDETSQQWLILGYRTYDGRFSVRPAYIGDYKGLLSNDDITSAVRQVVKLDMQAMTGPDPRHVAKSLRLGGGPILAPRFDEFLG